MSQNYPSFFFFLCMLFFTFLVLVHSAGDCLENGSMITDGSGTTLVSPSKVFELGFFTPDGSLNKNRYLGIWYYGSNPNIVVWVANRDNPVLVSNSKLVVEDGYAEVLDVNNSNYWKTDTISAVSSTELCLNDEGNLILSSDQGKQVLWQSFDHPTDTFLPGMTLNGSLNLTSWRNRSDPGQGNAHLLLKSGKEPDFEVKEDGYPMYWDSKIDPSTNISSDILKLLNNKTSLPNNTRLVMNFTVLSGQVQLWTKRNDGVWNLSWFEPRDRCSFDAECGNFGSCNSNNGLPCKCLPGFKPSSQPDWDMGCYTGGCVPKSGNPSERRNCFNDTFLKLPMMKVGEKDCNVSNEDVESEEDCKKQCLGDITCVAFSYGGVDCDGTRSSAEKCLKWNHLARLTEQYDRGLTLFVRAPSSDIELTSRDCKPCGAYAIPYPLSTDGARCGDSSYFNLHCNSETGQVNFSTPTGTFRITLIDPDTKNLYVQVMHANSCDSEYLNSIVLSSNNSLPFYVRSCSLFKDDPLVQLEQPFIEVELGWKPPPEPTCSEFSDCLSWNHTSCKSTKRGEKRCICGSKYHWDGLNLKCTKVAFPMQVVIICVVVTLVTTFLCCAFFVYHKQKRRQIAEKQGSVKFQGDDNEGVDVPFFSWGSILAATNNFADANKLGTGGFGSVYRGKLPDGKEIAVKKLSSVSMQGVAEFRTEVMLIARLQHRNLVRLLGYCVKAGENILVYEYMPNGSLHSCLFDQTFSVFLEWGKRYDIIFGIARGLVYLHQDSRLRVVHRDLKPSNILLDEELNPKISDFGIARIVGGKETEGNTNKVVGTYGYMSPEYACEGFFSFKSDVFSFGVVVLETISGRRNARSTVFDNGLSLLGHAWKLWNEEKGLEFIDPMLKESCDPTQVLKCMQVGLLCVQDDPIDRPTMSTVVLMLSNESSASQAFPKKPSFFNKASSSETATTSSIGGSSFFSNMITVSTVGR